MKNTQKKLKTKHFRYLSKEYAKNPNLFLKEVVYQWGIDWSTHINYFINSCIYPPMRTKHFFEYGFIHVHLGQMIEIGYVVMIQCNWKPVPKSEVFQYRCTEIFTAEIEDNIVFPSIILRDFFSFKTLQEWYKVLDELQLSRDLTIANSKEVHFGIDYIPVRELLVKLPKALLEIHNRGGLQRFL